MESGLYNVLHEAPISIELKILSFVLEKQLAEIGTSVYNDTRKVCLERSDTMEYISSFTYCDSIQIEMTPQGPRYQIVNPLQVLVPIAIPSNYSFAISVVLQDLMQWKIV